MVVVAAVAAVATVATVATVAVAKISVVEEDHDQDRMMPEEEVVVEADPLIGCGPNHSMLMLRDNDSVVEVDPLMRDNDNVEETDLLMPDKDSAVEADRTMPKEIIVLLKLCIYVKGNLIIWNAETKPLPIV